WSTHEWLYFIRSFTKADVQLLRKLDANYSFTSTKNAEIMSAWMQLTLRHNENGLRYETGTEVSFKQAVENYLVKVGRRKFLMPAYKALLESGQRDWAIEIYTKARPNYHA